MLHALGRAVTGTLEHAGGLGKLLWQTLYCVVAPPLRKRHLGSQMLEIGVGSLPVVLATGAFTGMVIAYQSYYQFKQLGSEIYVGIVIGLSMTKELGPVLTGLMLAGRVGAEMAAELGTMRVTEQIDALESLAVNPVRYLVMPRLLACTLLLPILSAYAVAIGIATGYVVSVKVLNVDSGFFLYRMYDSMRPDDVWGGLLKAMVFGLIIGAVACYRGLSAAGGAEGVGQATTRSVVEACILILGANLILTVVLFL